MYVCKVVWSKPAPFSYNKFEKTEIAAEPRSVTRALVTLIRVPLKQTWYVSTPNKLDFHLLYGSRSAVRTVRAVRTKQTLHRYIQLCECGCFCTIFSTKYVDLEETCITGWFKNFQERIRFRVKDRRMSLWRSGRALRRRTAGSTLVSTCC